MADERARYATRGFTLLEMLVALAVFSLAALALLRLQSVSLRTASDLDERQIARVVAHNLMVETQTMPGPLAAGETEGAVSNGGRQWRWEQKVSPTDSEGVMRVDLRVTSTRVGASPAVLTFLRGAQS